VEIGVGVGVSARNEGLDGVEGVLLKGSLGGRGLLTSILRSIRCNGVSDKGKMRLTFP
jgi:hypothetical protein